jgi:hypothetical protein
VAWTLEDDEIALETGGLRQYSDESNLRLDGPTTVTLSVTFVQSGGSTITYVQETTVVDTGDEVGVLWPPEERVCRLTSDCERTYIPGGDYAAGVSVSSNVSGE